MMMRSLLFVPADGGKKLEKAMASGADAVILDLEDSVTVDRKPEARKSALAFLKDAGKAKSRPRLLVRINGLDTGMTDATSTPSCRASRTRSFSPRRKAAAAPCISTPS